jgi:hypothetical protein
VSPYFAAIIGGPPDDDPDDAGGFRAGIGAAATAASYVVGMA